MLSFAEIKGQWVNAAWIRKCYVKSYDPGHPKPMIYWATVVVGDEEFDLASYGTEEAAREHLREFFRQLDLGMSRPTFSAE